MVEPRQSSPLPRAADCSISAAAMRELDRATIHDLGLPGMVLMEHAGFGAARVAARMMVTTDALGADKRRVDTETAGAYSGVSGVLGFDLVGLGAFVLCGKGNNGGDGFVIARHLFNAGADVIVCLFGATFGDVKGEAATNLAVLQQMVEAQGLPRLRVLQAPTPDEFRARAVPLMESADLIVDALFGTGLDRDIAPPYDDAIQAINVTREMAEYDSQWQRRRVLALDLPSGLHADTGRILGTCVKADATATLGLAKHGLFKGDGPANAGDVYVVDIGLPRFLVERAVDERLKSEA